MKRRLTIFKTKQNAFLLTAFATVCTLAVSLTNLWTAPIIEQQKQQAVLKSLYELLDETQFDNNPLQNCAILSEPQITGTDEPVVFYRAQLGQEPYALVYETKTEQGYNGLIELLTAVDNQGKVQGVRTISHQETPGLGDKIELRKSDWILSFNQKQVESLDDSNWQVKKDGGRFDQFTGATITPRAIVEQLRTSVFNASGDFQRIFSAPNDCLSNNLTNDVGNTENTLAASSEQGGPNERN